MPTEAYIYDAIRTPRGRGKKDGSLHPVPAIDLVAAGDGAIYAVAGLTLLIAGIAEVMRCLVCIRDGRWLPRSGDVEELEVVLLKQHSGEAAR